MTVQMTYSNISKEQIAGVASEVIRRYRAGCLGAGLRRVDRSVSRTGQVSGQFFIPESFFVRLDCTESEFQHLNTVATALSGNFSRLGASLIGLSPVVIRYNVKLHKGFSLICTEIALG